MIEMEKHVGAAILRVGANAIGVAFSWSIEFTRYCWFWTTTW